MPDYKASTVNGSSYQRASAVTINNPRVGKKTITFSEEMVINLGSETISAPVTNLLYGLSGEFTAGNAGTSFSLLDGYGNPTGATATYQEVYLMLMSLYYHMAAERDAAAGG